MNADHGAFIVVCALTATEPQAPLTVQENPWAESRSTRHLRGFLMRLFAMSYELLASEQKGCGYRHTLFVRTYHSWTLANRQDGFASNLSDMP